MQKVARDLRSLSAQNKSSHAFPSGRRLRKRRDYLRVQSGRKVYGSHFILMVDDGFGRVGITVSKKLGGAVVRNGLKRKMKEVMRKIVVPPQKDLVVVAKRSAKAKKISFSQMSDELHTLVGKIS